MKQFPALVALLGGVAFGQEPVVEQFKLVAGDGAPTERFGDAVAIDGDRMLFGLPEANALALESGAAYVFHRDTRGWTQQNKLVASDARPQGRFGRSVDISGDWLLIGGDDSESKPGTAYFFHWNGSQWEETQRVMASDAVSLDDFGVSVSLDGERAIVGAMTNWAGGTNAGAAYVFERVGTVWEEVARLTPSVLASHDLFGASVSISGDKAVVGMSLSDYTIGNGGLAVVYERSATAWVERALLESPSPQVSARFGYTVAIDGETIAVGAPFENDGIGAVHLYERVGGAWMPEQSIHDSSAFPGALLGRYLALSEDRLAVGSHTESVAASALGAGAAFMYARHNGVWKRHATLIASDAETGDGLGRVALDGNVVVAAAPEDDHSFGADAGAAYVFEESDEICYVAAFCNGNGSSPGCNDCPCGNNSTTSSGCKNSQSDAQFNSFGAVLDVPGGCGPTESLTFELRFAVPGSFAVLFSGSSAAPEAGSGHPCAVGSGTANAALGDGLRCIAAGSGSVLRHGVRGIDPLGEVALNGIGSDRVWGGGAPFQNAFFSAGETRHFQAFYRDVAWGMCGSGQNSSQAITVEFRP